MTIVLIGFCLGSLDFSPDLHFTWWHRVSKLLNIQQAGHIALRCPLSLMSQWVLSGLFYLVIGPSPE